MDSAILSTLHRVSFLKLTGLENKSLSLLWRGSRDGFDAAAFHRLCDAKANTVTVIKNANGFIFGGFTSIPWSSSDDNDDYDDDDDDDDDDDYDDEDDDDEYQEDNTAFLFSLTNPSNTPLKLKVNLPQNAVCHYSSYGPIFGAGNDLFVSSLSNLNKDSYMHISSYEFPNGISGIEAGKLIVGGSDNSYQTVEIEVFQVV